ncbi:MULTISPECIES: AEC family transporter [Pseudoalteromonas]|uniref:AEC family transporter n=2 Tax=Pseudoalteromonas maricaloris TaxID=184924 RepID=A0ABZ0M992_9GAMM|nr:MULTISPECIES: AEC family transporter [Pseudoalteromonas]WOX28375.1 AEC family transporter [Pseudoalteromonas maricaloris]
MIELPFNHSIVGQRMSPVEILFPLIFIVISGFLSAKIGFIAINQLDGLRTFIFNLCIPVLLFSSMVQADLKSLATGSLLLSFYLPVALTYAGLYLFLFKAQHRSKADSAALALSGTYSNTVLVGLPIILMALGEQAAAMVFMIITFHSAMLFFMTFLLAARHKNKLDIAKPLLLNPIVISITSGLILNVAGLKLPSLILESFSWLAKPAIPGALFILGASLVQYGVRGKLQGAIWLSAVKLTLLPGLVYLFATYLGLATQQVQVVTLMSASPLGVNAYLVARQLDSQQATLAATVVLSTVLSMVSLTGWLYFLV